jgi:hypothetical protein
MHVKIGVSEEQAVDNSLYNNIIRSDSLEVYKHASYMQVALEM